MTTLPEQLAEHVIKEQALIIGPVAWEEAQKVSGLKVDTENEAVIIEGSSHEVLEKLVAQYEKLFGVASREVCRDAVRNIVNQLPDEEVPAVLK